MPYLFKPYSSSNLPNSLNNLSFFDGGIPIPVSATLNFKQS